MAVTNHGGVRSYPLDDDLILLDEARRRLIALNATAAFVWVGLTEGASPAELAAELSVATGVSFTQAARDIDGLLAAWRTEGLLEPRTSVAAEPPPLPAADHALPGKLPDTPAESTVERVVRLLDAEVRVVAGAEVAGIVDALFDHALVRTSAAGDRRPVLRVFLHDGQWLVIFEDEIVGRCARFEELAAVIYGTMLQLTYETANCFAVIHAGAVAAGERCVLMPGESGSGKSTLTAALIAYGYDYCTDDLAILTAAPVSLRPVPLMIGLKAGSWPSLASSWPELASLPIYERGDGKRLKYLSPGTRRARRDALAIAALVFPVFTPGAKAQLRAVARSEALVRTTTAGYDFADSLDDAAVRVLLEKFRELPCYELRFDDLGEAVAAFSQVLPR